jgi:acetyl esterase
MPLDPDVAAFLAFHADGPRMEDLPVEEFRAAIEAITDCCSPDPDIAQVQDLTVPAGAGHEIPVRIYHPEPGEALPVVVYFHGGGWFAGSITHMDPVCRALAVMTRAVVVNTGYRLAPEHPFPAPLDDAWTVTRWAAAEAPAFGGDPRQIAVAGDSAGAALATIVCAFARDRNGPAIAHQLLVCPALDTAMDTPSYKEVGDGYGCTHDMMRRCWTTYLGLSEKDLSTAPWQAAPMRAPDLSGLPPATVLTMEYDPLRDEGEAYAARLAAAGVAVDCHRHDGMIHCALHLDGIAPRAAEVRQHCADALRRAFADPFR